MNPTRVLIAEPDNFSTAALAMLVRAGCKVEARVIRQDDIRPVMEQYDVLWVRLNLRVPAEVIPAKLRCRWIVSATTGTDHLDVDALARAGVEVLCLRGEQAFLETIGVTSELALGLVIALARRLPAAISSVVRDGIWDRDSFRGVELYGKTAGIVGLGRLGRKMAGFFSVLGMEILGCDPHVVAFPPGVERVASLDDLLSRAWVVTVHVPLNDETRGMFDARRFRSMRPGAFFINTSRGGIVNEKALLDALTRGHLGGAALDVLCGEPLINGGHPLVQYAARHDNLIITPHVGGSVEGVMARCEEYMAGKLLEYLIRDVSQQCTDRSNNNFYGASKKGSC